MGASQEGGGTLHCPSPTQIHHVDPALTASALRQMRRSLSRSPSKGPTFRLVTTKSASSSPGSPLSPSPLSPHVRLNFGATSLLSNSDNSPLPSPLAIPNAPATKKYRIGTRKVSPTQADTQLHNPLRSPIKRGLGDSTDLGNSSQSSSNCSAGGVENRYPRSPTPAFGNSHRNIAIHISSEKSINGSDSLLAPRHAFSRPDKSASYFADHPAKSSPLKRSDGSMDLDPVGFGSPSAKRRSLHGASFGADFDIFDQTSQSFGSATTDNFRTNDRSMAEALSPTDASHIFSPQRRKSSSLRRTTLHQLQRSEKPNFARSKPNTDLAHEFTTPMPGGSKNRPRISLDNFLPLPLRDSPFSTQGALPNASIHLVTQRKEPNLGGNHLQTNPHPLSRTLSQSSSASTLAEDSPTHYPVRQPEARRPFLDFSKSIPYGVTKPKSQEQPMSDALTQISSTDASFSTPENYKLARPEQRAFVSTGLVSKRHKDPIASPENRLGISTFMPDTPCKRPTSMAEAIPHAPGAPSGKSRHIRHSLHNFGTPSTPYNAHAGRSARSSFVRGVNIFGSNFNNKVNRRGSFINVENGDTSPSPSHGGDSQSSVDFIPSTTPSKLVIRGTPTRKGQAAQSPEDPSRALFASIEPVLPTYDSKSNLQSSPRGSINGDGESHMEDSPSTSLRFKSFSAISSFSTRSRLLRRQFKSPTPLSKQSFNLPRVLIEAMETKSSPLSSASPTSSRRDAMSPRAPHTPHTPHHEGVCPPDPSGLSISAQGDGQANTSFGSNNMNYLTFPPPSTPTASRDYFSQLGKSNSTTTPTHGSHAADHDPILTAKFREVEVIGSGEFAQVYRVTGKLSESGLSPSGPSKNPSSEQVFAVKKSRNAFIGARDRAQKLKEVEVLKALGHCNHTIRFFDSWESRKRLYILTEYCEDGTLELWMTRVGRKARLDDFRIWKVALELALGLQHIHDSGFIHLDLKPANVFISHDGCLKIGDFGLATSWPANPHIEAEGDREYIGPEILRGQFDKPADIFSLGLILLEIAGNVDLPQNGESWQRLRAGDWSDVPSLTMPFPIIERNESGEPQRNKGSLEKLYKAVHEKSCAKAADCLPDAGSDDDKVAQCKLQAIQTGHLPTPPDFMLDGGHAGSLDTIVHWMLSPEPRNRPMAAQIIETIGCQWAQRRRTHGAAVFEGNYGPAEERGSRDAEMLDA